MTDPVNDELPGTAYVEPGSAEHILLSEARSRFHLWKNIFIGLGIFAASISILINLVVITQVQKSTNTLIDCTTPSHGCYERGRSATSGAVGTINRVTIAAIACSKIPGNTTLTQIQVCVQKSVK